MPTRESHALGRRRKYEGESSAGSLVNWLNVTDDHEARARIDAIRYAFIEVTYYSFVTEPENSEKARQRWAERAGQVSQEARIEKANQHLNDLLRYYTVVPWILVRGKLVHSGQVQFVVGWQPIAGSPLDLRLKSLPDVRQGQARKSHNQLPGSNMGEMSALRDLIELIESGMIAKVIPCRCGKFYFRKFSHQHFCSQKCRIAESRDSDEARAKRAAYARKLYHLHKSGNVK
jgi:hypothetical protein